MLSEPPAFQLRNLLLTPDEDETALPLKLARRYHLDPAAVTACRILRKGLDARKKGRIRYVYTLAFTVVEPAAFWQQHAGDPDLAQLPGDRQPTLPRLRTDKRIVVVGSGPAGLFASLRLTDYGLTPLLLERGQGIEQRVRAVERFWRDGLLDEENNVQFGEGGAGTFSDGKLTTRVRDAHMGYVLRRFVEFGAPPEIEWLAKPHIGTDRLRLVLLNLRRFLTGHGVEVRFGAKLTDLQLRERQLAGVIVNGNREEACDALLLAPGHSSRDTYAMLECRGVSMEQKPFAVGLRVEHPQEVIDRIQYGSPVDPRLPPADYALAWNDTASGRSAYSFCMCPGGVVIGGASEAETVVTNGMSVLKRDSGWANSALVASVKTADFGDRSPLAGIALQRRLERAAFRAGGGSYRAPAQSLLAFLGIKGGKPAAATFRPGVTEAELALLFPEFVTATLRQGITAFERKMRGFITAEATLIGVESRTSAPLRILRGEDFQSPTVAGLYPCGEGAGYAGGIVSAALDGIRVADAIAKRIS